MGEAVAVSVGTSLRVVIVMVGVNVGDAVVGTSVFTTAIVGSFVDIMVGLEVGLEVDTLVGLEVGLKVGDLVPIRFVGRHIK